MSFGAEAQVMSVLQSNQERNQLNGRYSQKAEEIGRNFEKALTDHLNGKGEFPTHFYPQMNDLESQRLGEIRELNRKNASRVTAARADAPSGFVGTTQWKTGSEQPVAPQPKPNGNSAIDTSTFPKELKFIRENLAPYKGKK